MEKKKQNESALNCGRAIEGKVFKGNTFEIQQTETGVLYHCYGGYSIFVTPNNKSLYDTLNSFIEIKENLSSMTAEELNDFDLTVSAISYILNTPLIAFSDQNFTFDLATFIINYLRELTAKADEAPLEHENPNDNAAFLSLVDVAETFKANMSDSIDVET
jgi:UDP-galactopyranose mutase